MGHRGASGVLAVIGALSLWAIGPAQVVAFGPAAQPSPIRSTNRTVPSETDISRFDPGRSRLANLQAARVAHVPQVAPLAAPACNGAWTTVATPNNGYDNNIFNGMTAFSPTDVWAVGSWVAGWPGPQARVTETLIEHWDGGTWTIAGTPDVGPNRELFSVSGATASDIWAVGSEGPYNNQGTFAPMTWRYNGNGWTSYDRPTPGYEPVPVGAGDNRLFAVTAIATNDVWAVGYWKQDNNTGTVRNPLAWHGNGVTWSQVPVPRGSGTESDTLFSLSATGSGDVWAVGESFANGIAHTLVEHYNGTAWSVVSSPNVGSGDNILYGVGATSATNAWAVGFSSDASGIQHTLIEQWNGVSWSVVPSPNIGGSARPLNFLFSLSAVSSTNAWAAGAAYAKSPPNTPTPSAENLTVHWDGSTWSAVPTANASGLDELNAIAAVSATQVWATGDYINNGVDQTLAESLCLVPPAVTGVSPSSGPLTGGNQVTISGNAFSVATGVKFGNVAATSFVVNSDSSITATAPAQAAGTVDVVVTNPAGQSPVTAADNYTYVPPPTVVSVSPSSGPEAGGTPVTITGTNFTPTSSVSFGGFPAASVVVNSATSITAASPAHCPGVADVTVTTPGGTSLTSPADRFTFIGDLCAAVSTMQYSLTGSDGATWTDIDSTRLSITLTPNVNSRAILSANADLWTSRAGYNQDLALTVNGVVSGWKESGGVAGTFSPNAAFVQTVADMTAGISYTISVQWKSNKPDPGTIWAGAGPVAGRYSPTSLTMLLVPSTSMNLTSAVSTQQYLLTGNDGSGWSDLDPVNLTLPDFTAPAGGGTALINGNVDLWTTAAGYNQDIAIRVVDVNALACTGGLGTYCEPNAWKESGGFADTFSPNAAFVQTTYQMAAGHKYRIWLQWKTNKADPNTIVAGAGPNGGPYSPTRLTMLFYPAGSPINPLDAVTGQQYRLAGNDGSTWSDIDSVNLAKTVSSTTQCLALLSANADLWTSSPGFNQDIGISVNGNIVAWKESGGFAGTFSPNAAYVQIPYLLQANTSYTIGLTWKVNKADAGSIWAGAGPIGTTYSPTRLTIQLDGCS